MNNKNNRKDIPNFKRNDDGKRDNRDRRDLSSAIFFLRFIDDGYQKFSF